MLNGIVDLKSQRAESMGNVLELWIMWKRSKVLKTASRGATPHLDVPGLPFMEQHLNVYSSRIVNPLMSPERIVSQGKGDVLMSFHKVETIKQCNCI